MSDVFFKLWFKMSKLISMDLLEILFLKYDKCEYNSYLPLTLNKPRAGENIVREGLRNRIIHFL